MKCPLCGAEAAAPDDFAVDLDSNMVRAGAGFFEVTPSLAELAWLLRRAWPSPMHRERLSQGFYGARAGDPPDPKIFDVLASRLRRVLAGSGWTVLSCHDHGYRLARGEWTGLSRRQQWLVDTIAAQRAEHGRWPAARTLRRLGVYESRQSFYQALAALEARGLLRRRKAGPVMTLELATPEAGGRRPDARHQKPI